MKNVEIEVKGDRLVITVDLKKEFGRSKSGKSVIIASSDGNVSIPERPDIKLGLNVYK